MKRFLALAGGAGACFALTGVLGRALRLRVTDSRQSDRFLPVSQLGRDDVGEWVDFPGGSFAAHPGELYLSSPSGHSKLRLGPPELPPGVVRRHVLAGDIAALRHEGRGRLSGYLEQTPAALGLQYREVKLGDQRMWEVAGQQPTREDVWVIHVHGLGSRRSQTLRGVKTFSDLGFTSLVPTYRTSLDDRVDTPPRSHLGLSEWQDVARAQEHALAAGAEKIIYVGWSLGASIALQTIQRAPQPQVIGALLISPALDWREILLSAMGAMRMPRWLARWALFGFNAFRWGEDPHIDWDALPGVSTATDPQVPTLIFHGTHDQSVPVQLSRDATRRQAVQTRLVEFLGAHHTLEWNSDPTTWDREIRSWCTTLHLLNDTPANLEAA